jgi:hypothetical protein
MKEDKSGNLIISSKNNRRKMHRIDYAMVGQHNPLPVSQKCYIAPRYSYYAMGKQVHSSRKLFPLYKQPSQEIFSPARRRISILPGSKNPILSAVIQLVWAY